MEGKKKPHMTPAQKLWLAVKIQENKVLLFEKFNPKLTLEDKTAKWMEIFEECKAQGLPFTMTCGSDDPKDYKHLRNVVWPNLTRTTVVQ